MSPEGAIKKSICDYLSFRQDVFFWVQESQGTFDPRTRRFRKKNSEYQRNGIPDILLCLKILNFPPVLLGLEVKTKSNKQTDSQIKFEKDYKSFGGFYFVVRSIDDVQQALQIATQQIKSIIQN